MVIVIIAGGSGTRLWPMSTPEYPKQLLKINGDKRSLLQNTYDRAKKLGDDVYVIPDISHATHVKEQLSDLPEDHFIVEPGRRGTANCIVAALAHLRGRVAADQPVAMISADHYIRDIEGFTHSFKVAAEAAKKHKKIVLVGVEPDHAATGFGYIEKGEVVDEESYVSKVKSFKEKPDFETAKKYVASGSYVWNCSYFIATTETFEKEMKAYNSYMFDCFNKLAGVVGSDTYDQMYLSFESDAIDYALMERSKDLLVVPASFDWMDLGSFADMHKAADLDEAGNAISGNVETEDVENSLIHNDSKVPVAVVGLDNVVVINTKNGILVARKDLSQKVGDIAKRIS